MLLTGLSEQQERRSQTLMIDRLIKRYERIIAREIARAMRDAAKKYEQPLWQAEVRAKHIEKMTEILTRLWTQAGEDSGNRLLNVAKSLPKYEKKEITTEAIVSAISGWIRSFGSKKVNEVTATTMKNINGIIADGFDAGLNERDIARAINDASPIIGASRAQTIARTEAHGASQGMSLAVAQESDIQMVKVWITNIDERTRDSEDAFDHVDANGQTVGMSDKFKIKKNSGGVEELEYPGDPSGSAGNIINCRCVVGYEIAD